MASVFINRNVSETFEGVSVIEPDEIKLFRGSYLNHSVVNIRKDKTTSVSRPTILGFQLEFSEIVHTVSLTGEAKKSRSQSQREPDIFLLSFVLSSRGIR